MNSAEIIIGRWGKVFNGKNVGRFVFAKDDSAGSTGGVYIFIGEEPSFKKAHDYWVESKNDLKQFFAEAGW
jgi:hypothetical protein